jgi:copper chaperone CopZ
MERVKMKIDGMSCGNCVNHVRKALEKVPGVDVEQVEIGSATIAFDPASTNEKLVAQAIEDEGYAVTATTR